MKKTWSFLCTLAMALSLFSSHIATVQAGSSGNSVQNFANLVLFVQFADTTDDFMDALQDYNFKTCTYTEAAIHDYLDTTYPKSLVSYMDTISYGQFHVNTYMPQLNGSKITPIKLQYSRSYYDSWAMIQTAQTEAMDIAVNTASYGIASLNLDQDGVDGIDNVTFIFAGAEDARGNAFYAHKNNFEGSYKINGKYVGPINVLMADTIFKDDTTSTGEIAHEFMHSIGYPDLYHEGNGTPVGPWDMMAQASLYNQWPLAYMRSAVSGWLSIKTVTATSHLTLSSVDQTSGDRAYILKTPISDSEFFVVEYRKQGKQYSNELDVKIPGSGLIIYRINTRSENLSNRFGVDGVYVFRPGETSVTDDAGDLYSSYLSAESGRTSYGSTDMNKKITDGAIVYSDGQNSGITISNVGSAAGNTISFDVNFVDTTNIGNWASLGGSAITPTASNTSILATAVKNGSSYPSALVKDDTGTFVYQYDGSTWAKTTASIADLSGNASFVYYNDKPYVLYSAGNDYRLKLVYYDNGKWNQIADGSFPDKIVNDSNMIASGSSLYLAWNDEITSNSYNSIKIQCYNGKSFSDVATGAESSGHWFGNIKMCADQSGAYLTFKDLSDHNKLVLLKVSGTTATSLTVPSTGYEDPEIYHDGTNLYLLGASENSTGDTYLYKYAADNSSFSQLGTKIPTRNSNFSSLTVYQGVPFVQVIYSIPSTETADPAKEGAYVFRFENNNWWQEGLKLDSNKEIDHTSITMIKDKCYVGYVGNSLPWLRYKTLAVKADSSTASLSSIIVTPVKSSYTVGEAFQASDVVVNGIYSNMERKSLVYGTGTDTYTISGFDTSTAGTKTVTVQSGNAKDSYQITVTASGTSVPVSSITFDPASLSLKTGASGSVKAIVSPSNASNSNVTWSPADESIATVNSSGGVTAVRAGTTTIRATAQDGSNVYGTYVVTVTDPYVYVSGITLNTNSKKMAVGGTDSLSATVSPSDATNKSVIWSSSNSNVASVNNGTVTANSAGTATITATTVNGGYTASCTVTVKAVQTPTPTPTPTPVIAHVTMYRLYNPNSGEHFFTKNVSEKDYLASIGWNYEGVAWIAPETSNTPVYRLYNANGGEHHYTTNLNEKNYLVSVGWSYEDVGWYSDDSKQVPLYRVYNPNAYSNNHHYTTSVSERDWLISLGWNNEGIGWYGLS